jgi:CHAD domain-containing protein
MTEYLPPEGMSLPAAAQALARTLTVRDGRTRETERTFYDTFDGLLHHDGLSLTLESGELRLCDRETGTILARLADAPAAAEDRWFAFDLPVGPLREALSPIVEVRALLAQARVRSRERALDVLDDERKTVVRIALEDPALLKSARARVRLRPRLRLATIRGYERALEHVRETLEGELAFTPVQQPLVDEAVRAAGGRPEGVSSKPEVALEYEQCAGTAAAAVLRALLGVIEANYAGTLDDVDSEFLHDLRVAVRRTRAVLRELRTVFPEAELAHFRAEFRWLQQVTGDARDLDVYVLEFDRFRELVPADMRVELEPVLDVLRERRLAARASMVRALRSQRARRLRTQWATFLDTLDVPAPPNNAPAPPIGALAGERIRKVHRRMVRMGDAIYGASPPEAYHELRKKG